MSELWGGGMLEGEYADPVRQNLWKRIHGLEASIRKHRDQKGDDRCWLDDEELYKILPEGYTLPARDMRVELCNCVKFIQTRHRPGTSYVSPDREVERLKGELAKVAEVWGGDLVQAHINIIGALRDAVYNGDTSAAKLLLEKYEVAFEEVTRVLANVLNK